MTYNRLLRLFLLILSAPILMAASWLEGLEGKRIARIVYRGARKVEIAAIANVISSKQMGFLSMDTLAGDARAIWDMGFFEDLQIDVRDGPEGITLTYILVEKPSIRKITVGGNDKVDLDDINKVLDLKNNGILDIAQVKENAEYIRSLYAEKGYVFAKVDFLLEKVGKNRVDIKYQITEQREVLVAKIDIIGNRMLSDEYIKNRISIREVSVLTLVFPVGKFIQERLEEDLMRIRMIYIEEGYLMVKVAKPDISLSPDKSKVTITLRVTEGKRYKLGKITVEGEKEEEHPVAEIVASLRSPKEKWFRNSEISAAIDALSNDYKRRGYAYANISRRLEPDQKNTKVDLALDIDKGSPVVIERIVIQGHLDTLDKVIRREIVVSEGDLYNHDLIELSRARIEALGLFTSVTTSSKRGSRDDRAELVFAVAERDTGNVNLGMAYNAYEKFMFQGTLKKSNFLGRGQEILLRAHLGKRYQNAELMFFEPRFLDTRFSFLFKLYHQTVQYSWFSKKSYGGFLQWGYDLFQGFGIAIGYLAETNEVRSDTGMWKPSFRRDRVQERGEGSLASYHRDGLISSLKILLTWDRRDNRIFPRKGFYQQISADWAPTILGTDHPYLKMEAISRWYYPLWDILSFRLNIEIGGIFDLENRYVPVSSRYIMGGVYDVRGFTMATLGPQVSILNELEPRAARSWIRIGGNKKFLVNLELEVPLVKSVDVRGVIFTDAGMVFREEDPISLLDLRHSWGLGVRFFAPMIGMIRLEFAFPFYSRPDERLQSWHFAPGARF